MTGKISLGLFAIISLATLAAPGCKNRAPQIRTESPAAAPSPALVGVSAVFLRIVNSGGGDELVSARAEVPGTMTELHDVQDGKMVKVDSIPVPADETVLLRPARQHIMVFKLPADMHEGYRFTLVLKFKRSGEKAVPVEVMSLPAATSLLH